MTILFTIISWTTAIIFLFLSYAPLKESSEYRFTKMRSNLEGGLFLASAILIIFWSIWFAALGVIGIVLFKISSK